MAYRYLNYTLFYIFQEFRLPSIMIESLRKSDICIVKARFVFSIKCTRKTILSTYWIIKQSACFFFLHRTSKYAHHIILCKGHYRIYRKVHIIYIYMYGCSLWSFYVRLFGFPLFSLYPHQSFTDLPII